FNSRYKLDIQFGEQVESKFSLLWSAPRFVIDLINSVSIESFCNVKTLKQLPPGLDEASLWIGRIEDLLEECERIPADVAVNMNVTAAKKGVAVVETIFPASSRFMSSDSVSVNWEIQLNSYPELSLQVTSGPENAALTVQTTMNEITIDQYRYGRLEAICEALLE
ncbi:MAG: hypothetical protein NXI00_22750, partial [Cytophagales bacterium]|nr:hypothetical protein [Cytophagales bacterium]